MADIAASVLARLKMKAAESGRSYQLCLQLFCQSRLWKQSKMNPISICVGHQENRLGSRIIPADTVSGAGRDLQEYGPPRRNNIS